MNGIAAYGEPAERAAPITVSSADDARALLSVARGMRTGASPKVVVAVAGLPAFERDRWEARLGFWMRPCGCHTGALFALVAIVVCVVASPTANGPWWSTLIADAGIVIGAALAGKVAGIAAARWMLAFDVERLARRISALKP